MAFCDLSEMKQELSQLKESLRLIDGSRPREKRIFSQFSEGFPVGRLSEICGQGKTEFIALFLKETAPTRIAWVEQELTINPYGLWQRGVDLASITFIETNDLSWTIQQVLQSQIFLTVILSQLSFQERDLRRFQLLVEKSSSVLILLSETLHRSWVPSLQIEVSHPHLKAQIVRKRGYA